MVRHNNIIKWVHKVNCEVYAEGKSFYTRLKFVVKRMIASDKRVVYNYKHMRDYQRVTRE